MDCPCPCPEEVDCINASAQGNYKDEKAAKTQQLCEAAESGSMKKLFEALRSDGVDINGRHLGKTPLFHATFSASAAAVAEFLLQQGADAKITGSDNSDIPLHYAAWNNRSCMIEVLRRYVPDLNLNSQDRDGDTPLIMAASCDNTECVQLLLKWGADPHCRSSSGKTAMEVAAENKCWASVSILAEEIVRNEAAAATRICSAAANGEAEVLREYSNEQLSSCRSNGRTALMWAARAPNNQGAACVQPLLDAGASAEAQDFEGWTAAYYAACYNNDKVIALLPKQSLDLANRRGTTPLMMATYKANLRAMRQLLKAPVDVEKKNNNGYTAFACVWGRENVKQLLQEARQSASNQSATGASADAEDAE